MARRTPVRICFYAVNGTGLGHLTRLLALRQGLLKNLPRPGTHFPFRDTRTLFLTTSRAAGVLANWDLPWVKFPGKTELRNSGLSRADWTYLAQSQIRETLAVFRPHLLISDTFPGGSFGELENMAGWNHSFRVFINRERKPASFTRRAWRALVEQYHLVVVPHERGKAQTGWPLVPPIPVWWGGPLVFDPREEPLSRQAAGRELAEMVGSPDSRSGENRRRVLIQTGGGGDPFLCELDEVLDDVLRRRPYPGLVFYRIRGPLAGKRRPAAFGSGPGSNIVFDFREYPLGPLLPAFDLAISTAGYNSYHELRRAGVFTFFLPRERGLDDQWERARWGEAEGWARVVPAGITGREVANWLEANLELEEKMDHLPRTRPDYVSNHTRYSRCLADTSREIWHQFREFQRTRGEKSK